MTKQAIIDSVLKESAKFKLVYDEKWRKPAGKQVDSAPDSLQKVMKNIGIKDYLVFKDKNVYELVFQGTRVSGSMASILRKVKGFIGGNTVNMDPPLMSLKFIVS